MLLIIVGDVNCTCTDDHLGYIQTRSSSTFIHLLIVTILPQRWIQYYVYECSFKQALVYGSLLYVYVSDDETFLI